MAGKFGHPCEEGDAFDLHGRIQKMGGGDATPSRGGPGGAPGLNSCLVQVFGAAINFHQGLSLATKKEGRKKYPFFTMEGGRDVLILSDSLEATEGD